MLMFLAKKGGGTWFLWSQPTQNQDCQRDTSQPKSASWANIWLVSSRICLKISANSRVFAKSHMCPANFRDGFQVYEYRVNRDFAAPLFAIRSNMSARFPLGMSETSSP
jgi:hypothetical protein